MVGAAGSAHYAGGMQERIRVVVAGPGPGGPEPSAEVVARALRDAGMEVVYTGIRQTPATIAETALQEDVEAIGLSILSGAHLTLVPRVQEELRARGLGNVVLWVGGIIPGEDIRPLRDLGVAAVFEPGSTLDETVGFVRAAVQERRTRAGVA